MLMAITTLLDIRRASAIFEEELEQRGLLMVNTLNDVLADPLYFVDIDALYDIATIVSGHRDIAYLTVTDPSGNLLVDTRQGKYPAGSVDDGHLLKAIQGSEVLIRAEGGELEVTAPVQIGTQTVGGVSLGFGREALHDNIRALRVERLWQSAALILVASLLAFLLAQYFVRPLRRLVGVTPNPPKEGVGLAS